MPGENSKEKYGESTVSYLSFQKFKPGLLSSLLKICGKAKGLKTLPSELQGILFRGLVRSSSGDIKFLKISAIMVSRRKILLDFGPAKTGS